MLITFCKSKIAHARITEAELYYAGSITVDEELLKAVDILPSEKVEVLNLNNGVRLETYAIAGKAGSGQICLNGPAARCGAIGDKVILLSYVLMEQKEARSFKTKTIYLNDNNKIRK